jgi:outer membrane lipoprotein carrier protein
VTVSFRTPRAIIGALQPITGVLRAAAFVLSVGFLSSGIARATPAQQVEKYLGGLATWSADFTQTIDDGHGKVLRSAAGKLYLQRPGKFRWDYTEPSEQLVLADGKQIWFYDKDLAQANVRGMDATLANTPASLLSGGGSVSNQFDIKALPSSGGLEWFQLVPKHADTDFQLCASASTRASWHPCFSRTS